MSFIMSPVLNLGLLVILGLASALPTDPIIKLDPEIRYGLMSDGHGKIHSVDLWLSAHDLQEVARYTPLTQNVYHLFTRENPTISQPMLMNNNQLLSLSNFNPARRTIVIVHGWLDDVTADLNTVLVPAFLAADNVNVIVVDWSAGGGTINYAAAVVNTVISGEAVADFINWINSVTSSSIGNYHIVGHSLGGHQAGIISRNVNGIVPYVTALDAALPGWITNDHKFRASDGGYTEAIHTNAGTLGYLSDLAHVDFYPNGGRGMPGCSSNECSHDRCFFYLAESLLTGGFTGRRCASYVTAATGNCFLWGTLQMGGLTPKTGSSGVFYLETHAAPPFSQG